MINEFTNMYNLSKTLRFSLIPYWETEEYFTKRHLLDEDKERAESYVKVKEYMDRYHRDFIEKVLNTVVLNNIDEYCELYFKRNKSDAETKKMEDLEKNMRKQISTSLKEYKVGNEKLYPLLFKSDLIKKLLPEFLTQEEEKTILAQFNDFSTYFQGFWNNRKNLYTAEAKKGSIPYRCINDNLPIFLDNVKSFEKIINALPQDDIDELNNTFEGVYNTKIQDAFNVDYFSFVLSQSGIDKYNGIIGGYSNGDAQKKQGINEKVNSYNQEKAKFDKSKKLPFLKQLYKQILSDRETISFIPEKFNDDNEVLKSINDFYKNIKPSLEGVNELVSEISNYDTGIIYISAGEPVTNISNKVFGDWSVIRNNWNTEYELTHKKGRDEEKFYEKEREEYKKIKSFSISELQRLANSNESITEYIEDESKTFFDNIESAYKTAELLLSNEYQHKKSLAKNDKAVELIKTFLDSIKAYEAFLKQLYGSGKEEKKDNLFYGKFAERFEEIKKVNLIYNKVRNYITKKPYSNEKLKLNFQNSQFLEGWDKNKEKDYRTVLLKKDGKYFLGVMEKGSNKIFDSFPEDAESSFEKMEYKLLPDPSKMLPKVFFAASNTELFNPSNEILKIREKGSFKKGKTFDLNECHKFIDFYKDCIEKHPDWCKFGFKFTETKDYVDISKFFREVSDQGYSIKFRKISEEYLKDLVKDGKLYLFQIYNKDFSEYSKYSKGKGTANLHTLYFKMLFDERNLENVVYKLSGGAEMFYRKASIEKKDMVVHKKNQPIENKNPDNVRKESTFGYDIIKDKRYTKYQFQLHLPITLNYKAEGKCYNINDDVRAALKHTESNYVIGIDRGERNFVYACVVDANGKIVKQENFNVIEAYNGYKTDYHKLLNKREKEMDTARKSWKTIGSIKELKEGYISQVVHKICQLVIKYDAVIVMEDLNLGFMNSRKKVYQKFERMLTQKLNYLVDKKLEPTEMGGLLNAYQLTGVRKDGQDGIIFYIPAWLTSKIDPTTGFVDLLKPKYNSVSASKEFFNKFDEIKYNKDEDYFEFSFNYDNFPKCNSDFKKVWTVCTFGDRIKTFRDPEKNNQFNSKSIVLTQEFKSLFDNSGIDYNLNLKEQILSKDDKSFYKALIGLLSLTLQMRNSVSGNGDIDYLISPVKNSKGEFYDSRNYDSTSSLPCDADSNGAYNIARKGLWAVNQIKQAEDETKAKISIKNSEWLQYAQTQND